MPPSNLAREVVSEPDPQKTENKGLVSGKSEVLPVQCTLPHQPIHQSIVFNFSRVWFQDYKGQYFYTSAILATQSDFHGNRSYWRSGNVTSAETWHLDLCEARLGQLTHLTKVKIGLSLKLHSSCAMGRFFSHKNDCFGHLHHGG